MADGRGDGGNRGRRESMEDSKDLPLVGCLYCIRLLAGPLSPSPDVESCSRR